jgi:hypothetical protein
MPARTSKAGFGVRESRKHILMELFMVLLKRRRHHSDEWRTE